MKRRKPEPWQRYSWARRRLWSLVIEKFGEPPVGRREISITRDELVDAGVFGDFDESGRPMPAKLKSEVYT